MSYGFGNAHTTVKVWQLIFLVCGGLTAVWSAVVWFFLPADPSRARFLNARERLIAVDRLRANRTGLKSTEFKPAQVLEALTDPQCIIIALWSGISNITNSTCFLGLFIAPCHMRRAWLDSTEHQSRTLELPRYP